MTATGRPRNFAEASDERLIVTKAAVAVEFNKVGKHQADPVESVGPLRMPRDLGALPGTEMAVKLAAEFQHFPFQALDLDFAFVGGSQAAEIFDVFFQPLDFALAFERG